MTERQFDKMLEEFFGFEIDGNSITYRYPYTPKQSCKCVDTKTETKRYPVHYEIQSILANKAKGVFTVVWTDGTHTKITIQPGDTWDDEKALAMCFVKKLMGNKGNFNDIFTQELPAKLKTIDAPAPTKEECVKTPADSNKEKMEKQLKDAAKATIKASESFNKLTKAISDVCGEIKSGKYVVNLVKTNGDVSYECLVTDDAKKVHKYVADWAKNAGCSCYRSWEREGNVWIDYGSHNHYLQVKGMTANEWLDTK